MKYLGIDWGLSKIGLAIADDEVKIAFPLKTVNNFEEVVKVIREEEVGAVILGKPIKKSGEYTPLSQFVNFQEKLEKIVPVKMIDERFTTKEALRKMQESGQRGGDDALSAALILDNFFATSEKFEYY